MKTIFTKIKQSCHVRCFFPARLLNVIIVRFGVFTGFIFVFIFASVITIIILSILWIHFRNLPSFRENLSIIFFYSVCAIVMLMCFMPRLISFICMRKFTGLHKKLLIFPSSLCSALLVGKIAGVNVSEKIDSDFIENNKNTLVYEIHLKGKYSNSNANQVEEILDSIISNMPRYFYGTILYSITPINLKKRIMKLSMPYSILIDLETKINPNRAKRFREDPSHFWYYIVKL